MAQNNNSFKELFEVIKFKFGYICLLLMLTAITFFFAPIFFIVCLTLLLAFGIWLVLVTDIHITDKGEHNER